MLAVPALVLSTTPRKLISFFNSLFTLALIAAFILPPLFGMAITAGGSSNLAPFVLNGRVWLASITFGLGSTAFALVVGLVITYLMIGFSKRRWLTFYAATAGSAVLPLMFYLPMLHTPRFFLLTLASTLFLIMSRRTKPIFRSIFPHGGAHAGRCGLYPGRFLLYNRTCATLTVTVVPPINTTSWLQSN